MLYLFIFQWISGWSKLWISTDLQWSRLQLVDCTGQQYYLLGKCLGQSLVQNLYTQKQSHIKVKPIWYHINIYVFHKGCICTYMHCRDHYVYHRRKTVFTFFILVTFLTFITFSKFCFECFFTSVIYTDNNTDNNIIAIAADAVCGFRHI